MYTCFEGSSSGDGKTTAASIPVVTTSDYPRHPSQGVPLIDVDEGILGFGVLIFIIIAAWFVVWIRNNHRVGWDRFWHSLVEVTVILSSIGTRLRGRFQGAPFQNFGDILEVEDPIINPDEDPDPSLNHDEEHGHSDADEHGHSDADEHLDMRPIQGPVLGLVQNSPVQHDNRDKSLEHDEGDDVPELNPNQQGDGEDPGSQGRRILRTRPCKISRKYLE